MLDVTLIGVPDPKWDEVPLARVELVEQFPRNALGKVLKKELRAAYGQ